MADPSQVWLGSIPPLLWGRRRLGGVAGVQRTPAEVALRAPQPAPGASNHVVHVGQIANHFSLCHHMSESAFRVHLHCVTPDYDILRQLATAAIRLRRRFSTIHILPRLLCGGDLRHAPVGGARLVQADPVEQQPSCASQARPCSWRHLCPCVSLFTAHI